MSDTAAGRPNPGSVFRDNIVLNNQYGVIGNPATQGGRKFPDVWEPAGFR